jgi:hypothetical protein
MLDRWYLAGVLLLCACSKPYAAPASIQTSATPDQSFQCVQKQMDSLGYKRNSYDTDERRITATKIDPDARRPDTQFRRLLNRMEAEVQTEPDGRTNIQVTGHTFAEYTTQRGPTEVEEKPTQDVRSATQQVLDRCRS